MRRRTGPDWTFADELVVAGHRTLAAAAAAAEVPQDEIEAALPSIGDVIRRGYVVLETGAAG